MTESMRRPLRAALVLFAAVLLVAGCAATPPTETARPRLVVLLVVDGFPQWQLTEYRDQLAPDGLRRFLDRGAWFSDAHYGHAITATAPGHATLLTGAYPHRTGIIDNEWIDRATGQLTYCTADPAAAYIGHNTKKLDGTSPKNLRVETVGDVLKRMDARSKVIAISGKDRGAILPAGRTGVAYMYQAQTGQFASSTYYMPEHPQWVKDFHAKKPADAFFHKEWKPLLEEAAYAKSLPDGQKWYRKGGKLPMKLGEADDKPSAIFYAALLASPFADHLTLDFARAALAGESLGRDDAPDILSVSLSSHDYVNHGFGAESRLSHDHVLQVDRALEAFFRDLDATVGKDNYVAVFTSDHGFMPAPEHSQLLGRDAGRLSGSQTVAKVNAALSQRFGEGRWATGFSAKWLVLDKALIAQRNADFNAVAEEARKVLAAEGAVAAAYTRAEIEGGSRAEAPFFDQVRKAFDRERSGDVAVVLKPYWMFSSSSSMTTHGSAQRHDTHVPIAFYGPRWVGPGRIDARVEVADIAPTLARILDVAPPTAAEGKPLPLKAPAR